MFSKFRNLTEIDTIKCFSNTLENLHKDIYYENEVFYDIDNKSLSNIISTHFTSYPLCITFYSNPLYDDTFAPNTIAIYADTCGNIETYLVSYKIKETDMLQHQWQKFTASYIKLIKNKKYLPEAISNLEYYFELALNNFVIVDKVEKITLLSYEEQMLKIFLNINDLNVQFYMPNGELSDDDNLINEYYKQTKYFFYKYISRWASLSREYFDINNKTPDKAICNIINWPRIQKQSPKNKIC